MKKRIITLFGAILVSSFLLTSCYTYNTVVGNGGKGEQEITEWNHYLIYGLIPVGVSDSKAMAGDATDYTVKTRLSFVNGLLSAITFGIYTPSTTTVKK